MPSAPCARLVAAPPTRQALTTRAAEPGNERPPIVVPAERSESRDLSLGVLGQIGPGSARPQTSLRSLRKLDCVASRPGRQSGFLVVLDTSLRKTASVNRVGRSRDRITP